MSEAIRPVLESGSVDRLKAYLEDIKKVVSRSGYEVILEKVMESLLNEGSYELEFIRIVAQASAATSSTSLICRFYRRPVNVITLLQYKNFWRLVLIQMDTGIYVGAIIMLKV